MGDDDGGGPSGAGSAEGQPQWWWHAHSWQHEYGAVGAKFVDLNPQAGSAPLPLPNAFAKAEYAQRCWSDAGSCLEQVVARLPLVCPKWEGDLGS